MFTEATRWQGTPLGAVLQLTTDKRLSEVVQLSVHQLTVLAYLTRVPVECSQMVYWWLDDQNPADMVIVVERLDGDGLVGSSVHYKVNAAGQVQTLLDWEE